MQKSECHWWVEEWKNEEKLPVSCYLLSSLTVQSVTPECVWGRQSAAEQQWCCLCPAAQLHCCGWGTGWSISCGFENWWCWSSTVKRFPFPLILSADYFAIILAHLLHQTRAYPVCCFSHTLSLRALHFYIISHLLCVLPGTFKVPISGIPAKFRSQHLFLTLSWLHAFILGPLKRWLFQSCVSLNLKAPEAQTRLWKR